MNEIIQSTDAVVKDEQYEALLQDLHSAEIEYRKRRAYDLVALDHYLGRAMHAFVEQKQITPTALVRELVRDTGKSERGLWSTYMLWKDRPNLQEVIDQACNQLQVPEVNLTQLRAVYLTDGTKEHSFDPQREAKILIKKYGKEKARQVAETILSLLKEDDKESI